LLSEAERKNSWQVAEVSGEAIPYGFEYWLSRADWDADAGRDALSRYVSQQRGILTACWSSTRPGCLKKGAHAAGVARQSIGTAGTVENCQIGVLLSDASPLGHALLDRELYLPKSWTDEGARGRQAGIPADRPFATKPPLTQQMLNRAFRAGVPANWGTGDGIYGSDRRLRLGLEAQPPADVLAVSGQEYVGLAGRQRQVKTILTALPEEGWGRLSAGDDADGPRWYNWRWLPLAAPRAPDWRRWLLVRRRLSTPTELTA
jgi:SRSO17 transposase